MTESAEEEKLIDYVARGEKIPWKKVYRVPSHVYFSHRRHVTLGQIECATCHGHMEEMTNPPTTQFVAINMDWCIECHERNGIDDDCIRCHR